VTRNINMRWNGSRMLVGYVGLGTIYSRSVGLSSGLSCALKVRKVQVILTSYVSILSETTTPR